MTGDQRRQLRARINAAMRQLMTERHYCPDCDRWLDAPSFSPSAWVHRSRCRSCQNARNRDRDRTRRSVRV